MLVSKNFNVPFIFNFFIPTYSKKLFFVPGIIFSTLGLLLSGYHYALQNEWLGNQEIACSTISCGIKYVNYYGFITIPLLAFIAFSLIIISLILGNYFNEKTFSLLLDTVANCKNLYPLPFSKLAQTFTRSGCDSNCRNGYFNNFSNRFPHFIDIR